MNYDLVYLLYIIIAWRVCRNHHIIGSSVWSVKVPDFCAALLRTQLYALGLGTCFDAICKFLEQIPSHELPQNLVHMIALKCDVSGLFSIQHGLHSAVLGVFWHTLVLMALWEVEQHTIYF